MTNKAELDFKQHLVDYFNQRSSSYDEGDFHPQHAHRLVEYAQIQSGQNILDAATGTGMVAIEAAQIVGSEGHVVGVDISDEMLKQAKQKSKALSLNNIEFIIADAESLDFSDQSFDQILCCSALAYLRNISATLRQWYRLLKPQGQIGFSGFSDTSFVAGTVLINVARKHGIELIFNQPTGTTEKCSQLLKEAGCEEIEVKTEELSSYLTLSQVKGMGSLKNPLCCPLLQLSSEELEQLKAEYDAELETLVTDKGIWNETTAFFAFGRKKV